MTTRVVNQSSMDTSLFEALIAIARGAGARIMEIYHRGFTIARKDDRSPLTEADLASHRHIIAGLQALDTGLPILSEESATIAFADRRRWSRYWLIDPLDGTRDFIKRNGEFTVNIALIEGHRPLFGLIHAPALDRLYYGGRDLGAWRQESGGAASPIRVAGAHRLPVRVCGSRSHGSERLQGYLANLGEHSLHSLGSSLKFCLVAEGEADIYPRLGPTSEWDTAAAQAIVEAAGGRVTDLQMQPLRYNTKDSLINPQFLVFGDLGVEWNRFAPGDPA